MTEPAGRVLRGWAATRRRGLDLSYTKSQGRMVLRVRTTGEVWDLEFVVIG